MKLLELQLLAIDERRFTILFRGDGQSDVVETNSELPFFSEGTNWCRTALRCVETSLSFQEKTFSLPEERAWMRQAELLTPQNEFSLQLRTIIGKALYCALFPPGKPSERALYTALGVARRANETLHIRFKFSPKSSERSRLADYPWELIYQEDIADFLFQQRDIVCSRWLAYEAPEISAEPIDQLRVWVISSRPHLPGQPTQALSNQEIQQIRNALESSAEASESRNVELEIFPQAKFDDFSDRLLGCPAALRPQVIHFDGHGLYGQRCPRCNTIYDSTRKLHCNPPCSQQLPGPEGWLMFEDEQQQPDYVSAKDFAKALQPEVKLVVLSACQSAMATVGSSQFNGVAQRLIAQRIPAVVAMQYAVEENAASRFCGQLYRCLSQYQAIAPAVAAARQRMDRDLRNQWYRPVLYLRSSCEKGGQLLCSESERHPLTQPLERLYQILKPHQRQLWDALREAYQATLPELFESERAAQTLRQKFTIFATELPQQNSDEWSPEARFADAFLKAPSLPQSLPEGLQEALQDWAEQVEPRLASIWRERVARGQPQVEVLSQQQATLRLSVRPALQDKGKYHLIAALVRDANPRGLEDQEPSSVPIKQIAAIASHEISAWLDELIEVLCGDQKGHGITLSQLAVECCLPLELLYLALDIDWSIKVGRRRRLPLSIRCQSFVVRALDRHLPDDNKANAYVSSKGEWKENWRHADQNAKDAWLNYFAKSSLTMPEMLDEFMKKNCFTAWQFNLPSTLDERENLLDGMLGEGVPIALWLRAPASSDENSEVASEPPTSLEEVLRDPNQDPPHDPALFEIPQAVTTARKRLVCPETAEIKRLALMWDNPFRPIPKILYEQPSESS